MSEPVLAQVEDSQKNSAENNLKKQREHYEHVLAQERGAREAAEKKLQELHFPKGTVSSDDDDDDEPYVDRKKLKKVLSGFEAEMEKKIDARAEQKARMLVDEERTARYLKENSDFNQIMGSDIVQKFADAHPALAENILRMPEGFERQKLVYQTIKSMGFDKPQPKAVSVQDKINSNMRSPFYQPSGMGAAPYAQQGDFSESGQKNAYAKLQELKKNIRI